MPDHQDTHITLNPMVFYVSLVDGTDEEPTFSRLPRTDLDPDTYFEWKIDWDSFLRSMFPEMKGKP